MMKRFVVIGTSAILSALVSAGIFGGGVASADYTGQTYAQASENIEAHGMKAVISSVVGDQLAQDDCVVTNAKTSSFLNSSGVLEEKTILLALNCNETVAKPGTPGNSLATPEGKAAKKDQGDAEYFNTHPEWCLPDGKYRSPCARVCKKNSSLCSDDVLDAVATT
jgi:nickel-dependent lactate racemase